MQSLIDNPPQQNTADDNSDKFDIDLDFEELVVVGSRESTDK